MPSDHPQPPTESATPAPSEAALAELTALNSWNKAEADAVERPDAHPNYVASGESYGWISVHKEKLATLGYTATWDAEKRVYVLGRK